MIFTEYKQTKRIRAQVLGLKVAKAELEYLLNNFNDGLTSRLDRQTLRLEIGTADREIWLWPVAIRAPMAHSRVQGGVHIEDKKTSYQMNPGVGYTLGGGFHCTTFDNIAQIFREGLRPGGGGDRINTFFVPFAPWDVRSQAVLRFRKIEQTDLVYIYITYDSIAKFSPRLSADGHILFQETIPFESFDAVWYYDWREKDYYRLMITKGRDQLVLSVQGAKRVATIERFDKLIGNMCLKNHHPIWTNFENSSISGPVTSVILTDCSMDIRIGMMQFHYWQSENLHRSCVLTGGLCFMDWAPPNRHQTLHFGPKRNHAILMDSWFTGETKKINHKAMQV